MHIIMTSSLNNIQKKNVGIGGKKISMKKRKKKKTSGCQRKQKCFFLELLIKKKEN